MQLDVIGSEDAIRLPPRAGGIPVVKGGPVETGRGFVLHSADYFVDNSTMPIDDDISLTATVDILRAIAKGTGPQRAMLALGYAGWAPGQLEDEIQHMGWLNCPADEGLIFDSLLDTKVRTRPAQARHQPGHAVGRGRSRLNRCRSVSAGTPDGSHC